jgi:hypothetical protein
MLPSAMVGSTCVAWVVEDHLVHREGHTFRSGRRLPAGYLSGDVGIGHRLDLPKALGA